MGPKLQLFQQIQSSQSMKLVEHNAYNIAQLFYIDSHL